MAKTWATKCCSGTYKNNYQLCCGIKVYVSGLLYIRILTCGAYEEFVAYTSDMKRLNLICFVMKVIKTIDINIDNHD